MLPTFSDSSMIWNILDGQTEKEDACVPGWAHPSAILINIPSQFQTTLGFMIDNFILKMQVQIKTKKKLAIDE